MIYEMLDKIKRDVELLVTQNYWIFHRFYSSVTEGRIISVSTGGCPSGTSQTLLLRVESVPFHASFCYSHSTLLWVASAALRLPQALAPLQMEQ